MDSKFELFVNNKYYENTKERITYGETPFKTPDDYFRANKKFLIEKFKEENNMLFNILKKIRMKLTHFINIFYGRFF